MGIEAQSTYQKSQLRKLLGRCKYYVADYLRDELRFRAARRLKSTLAEAAHSLPPVSSGAGERLEVHVLCGAAGVDMGLWATWSLMRFLPDAALYIHSDGTLGEAEFAPWQRLVKGARLVSRADADQRVAHSLATCPRVRAWRAIRPVGMKFADPHLFGTSPYILLMDSDVLCFQPPNELLKCMDKGSDVFAWNRDVCYAFSAPLDVLREDSELPMPDGVNSGIFLTPRFGEREFCAAETVLDRFEQRGRVPITHHLFEQTLQAAVIAATGSPQSGPLSRAYAVTHGATTPDMVMRHYVGMRGVRPRYWTEGVPLLQAQIERSRQSAPLPAVLQQKSVP